jgi:hypothetical protein
MQPEAFAEIEIRRAENAAPAVGAPVSDPARSDATPEPVLSQAPEAGETPESPRQS